MTREEAITVLKAFMDNPLFSDIHKAAFNIALHDIEHYVKYAPPEIKINIDEYGDGIDHAYRSGYVDGMNAKPFSDKMAHYCKEHYMVIVDEDVWADAEGALKHFNEIKEENECKAEDCIKREEVCKYVYEFGNNEYSSDEEIELLNLIVDGIRHLPSVCPDDNGKDNNVPAKTGHWIYNNALFDAWTCSCCKCDSDKYTDYCPHCGAFMNEDVIEKQKGENT